MKTKRNIIAGGAFVFAVLSVFASNAITLPPPDFRAVEGTTSPCELADIPEDCALNLQNPCTEIINGTPYRFYETNASGVCQLQFTRNSN